MNTKYTYLYIPLLIILVCNLIWPPSQLMITDEVSYYFQLQNWLYGNSQSTIIDAVSGTTHSLIEGHYPPGTSFILSILYWIHKPLIYFSGLMYLLVSIFLLYKCLRKLKLPTISLSAIYLFLPLLFIARTTMSEMPSLLLVSIGIYLYLVNNAKYYFWLAFISGLSVAFRETNILLLAPLAFFISKNYVLSAIAFLAGLSFRFIGYYILTNNPLLIKEGYPFGIEFIPDTLIVYAIVLFILLPLSPLWFTKVPRLHLLPFTVGLLSFLGLHLVYGYVASVYSGYTNGVILNGRFWIPALPIFVVALGYFISQKSILKQSWFAIPVIVIITITTLGVYYKSSLQQSDYIQFSETLKWASKGQLTFIDLNSRTPVFRHIYPFATDRKWSDINFLNNSQHISQSFEKFGTFQVAILSSELTIAQSNRNTQFNSILIQLKEKYCVTNINELCLNGNYCLNIYNVQQQ